MAICFVQTLVLIMESFFHEGKIETKCRISGV